MEGLNSPTLYSPTTLSEYNSIALSSKDARLYAGCTSIAKEDDYYPEHKTGSSIISLSSLSELQRFSRNDKIIELGSGITLESILMNNKQNTLPPILSHNILSIGDSVNISHPSNAKKEKKDSFTSSLSLGSSLITSSATLGGAIASKNPITSIPATLLLLDASIELRYVKRLNKKEEKREEERRKRWEEECSKRIKEGKKTREYKVKKKKSNVIKTRWFDIAQLINDGKGKCVSLHPLSLITRIRFTSYIPVFSFFLESGSYTENPEDMVIMAFTSDSSQETLISPRLALTFPTKGIVSSKDLNNVFVQLHFPIFGKEFLNLKEIVLTFVNASLGEISRIEEVRLTSLLERLIEGLNTELLSGNTGEEKI